MRLCDKAGDFTGRTLRNDVKALHSGATAEHLILDEEAGLALRGARCSGPGASASSSKPNRDLQNLSEQVLVLTEHFEQTSVCCFCM